MICSVTCYFLSWNLQVIDLIILIFLFLQTCMLHYTSIHAVLYSRFLKMNRCQCWAMKFPEQWKLQDKTITKIEVRFQINLGFLIRKGVHLIFAQNDEIKCSWLQRKIWVLLSLGKRLGFANFIVVHRTLLI